MLIFKHLKKEVLVYTLVLNGPLFYFSACALLGIRPDPDEGAGIMYKIYMVSLLLMGFFLWFKNFLKGRVKILPLCILLFYAIVALIQGYKEHTVFIQMVCFSVPAACVALNMKGKDELAEIMKIMDLLLPILSFSFLFMIKNIYLSRLEGIGSYDQNASYFIAYCFLIDIFLLSNNNSYPKFKFLDKKWYTALKIALLPYFFVMAFFGGGRGAFITIIVGLFVVFVRNMKRISIALIFKVIFGLLLLLFCVFFVFHELTADYLDLFTENFGRITSLVDNGSIDTSASSGRDIIWKNATKLISEKPLLGYGIFSYLKFSPWPHNIFLEVLLQGGMFLLFILLVILLLAFTKYHRMVRFDSSQILLAPFMIWVFTELQFSGSYTFEPFFWFTLSYIYNFNFKRYNRQSAK